MRRLLAAALLVFVLVISTRARADCDRAIVAWAEACSARESLRVTPLQCPVGGVILSVDTGQTAPLRVEVARPRPGSFRVVGDLALSPIGDFADWSKEPLEARRAFEGASHCVETAPPPISRGELVVRSRQFGDRTTRPPWLLLGAAVTILGLFFARFRAIKQADLRTLAALLVLTVATYLLRLVMAPGTYFHQNGHGPMWAAYSLCDPSPYGPGFREIFGTFARLRPERPEWGIFSAQALFAALGPASAWWIGRRVSAPSSVCWAAALGIACDSLLARLASSESYYGVYASFLLLATALAAEGARAPRLRSCAYVLPTIGAALLAAQACRVHPTGFVAASLLPLVHLSVRGVVRRRLWRTIGAAGLMGAVVLLTSGGAIVGILRGGTGEKWLPAWRAALPSTLLAAAPLIVLTCGAALYFARRRRDGFLRAGALALVMTAVAFANMHQSTVDWVQSAYRHMYTGAFLAVALGVLASAFPKPSQSRYAVAGILLVSGIVTFSERRFLTELPTDALEYSAAMQWRQSLQPGASLVGLGRFGRREVDVNVFDICSERTGRDSITLLDASEPLRPLSSYERGTVYYRSSICSTTEGRPLCDALERTAKLEPIVTRTLPARESMTELRYDGPSVNIGLYRITSPK